MQIIINENSLAIFVSSTKSLTADGVALDGALCPQYNTSNCTEVDAPEPPHPVDHAYSWTGSEWTVFNQALIDNFLANEVKVFNDEQSKKRREAYVVDSDPIFFKYQRATKTKQEWLDAVAEVKLLYPYE